MKKFLRRTWGRYSKLGKGRKKKQTWRSPKGRHNKMREKEKGYPALVSVGYRKDKSTRGTIDNKKPVLVNNIKDLLSIKKDEIAIIGRVGKRNKIEMAKKARELKIQIQNLKIKIS